MAVIETVFALLSRIPSFGCLVLVFVNPEAIGVRIQGLNDMERPILEKSPHGPGKAITKAFWRDDFGCILWW